MSCECYYHIGGPFISYDPECPVHGDTAQQRESDQDDREASLLQRESDQDDREASLLQRIEELERKVTELRERR